MTFSQRAVEAAGQALRERDMSGRITVPWDKVPKGQRKKWMERGEAALTAALAVDGVVLQGWQLRSVDEWTEDDGDVLWWHVKDGVTQEAPWVGTPLTVGILVEAHTTTRIITQLNQDHDPESVIHRIDVGGWPGYHTHWQPLPTPPAASEGEERNSPPQDKP